MAQEAFERLLFEQSDLGQHLAPPIPNVETLLVLHSHLLYHHFH